MQNHLKPMGVRDILDSAFSIMRDRFWTFQNVALKAFLPPLLLLLAELAVGIVFIAVLALSAKIPIDSPQLIAKLFYGNITSAVSGVFFLFIFGIILLIAVIVGYIKFSFGVVKVFQAGFHQQPCTAKQAFQSLKGKKLRIFLTGFIIWFLLYIITIPGMLLSSATMSISALLSYTIRYVVFLLQIGLGFLVCLSPVVAVIEDWDVYQIIKRSFNLLRGHRWRVLGSLLLVYLLGCVLWLLLIGLAASPFFLLSLSHSPLLIALVILVAGVILILLLSLIAIYYFGPLTAIYYDLLIRKEGYDIQLQLKATASIPGTIGPECQT